MLAAGRCAGVAVIAVVIATVIAAAAAIIVVVVVVAAAAGDCGGKSVHTLWYIHWRRRVVTVCWHCCIATKRRELLRWVHVVVVVVVCTR